MTPEEKLEAAIVKLELERNHATKGEWIIPKGESIHPTWIGSPPTEFIGALSSAWIIGDAINPQDTQLIVTLHRTIDAQLSILYAARGLAPVTDKSRAEAGSVYRALALADAILGGEQS